MDKLADIIKLHRKKSGLTQKELADLAGVGKTLVYDLEHGKLSVHFDKVLKILKVLNIKLEFKSRLLNSK